MGKRKFLKSMNPSSSSFLRRGNELRGNILGKVKKRLAHGKAAQRMEGESWGKEFRTDSNI